MQIRLLITLSFSVFMTINTMSQFNAKRQILVFGKEQNAAMFQQQMQFFKQDSAGMNERNLVVKNIDTSNQLYTKYSVSPGTFTVILIGKDGGEKHRTHELLGTAALFAIVDAMPMRKVEIKRKQ